MFPPTHQLNVLPLGWQVTALWPSANGSSCTPGSHRSEFRQPDTLQTRNHRRSSVLALPEHNCAEESITNQQRTVRLPIPRANIELAAPRQPTSGLLSQLDETSKAQVKLLTKVQDIIEPLANFASYVTNESVRSVETARDDLAVLLSVCKLCNDKDQIIDYLETFIDPGVQPQDPVGGLKPKEDYNFPSLEELQYQCNTDALPEGTGPYSLRTQLAQLAALGDARVSIHKLSEEIFTRNRVKRPSEDPDPALLSPQDRRTFLSAEFYKNIKALPPKTAKRPHAEQSGGQRGNRGDRGRGPPNQSPNWQGQRGRHSQGRGGGRNNQFHHQQPYYQPNQRYDRQQPAQGPADPQPTQTGQLEQAQGGGQPSYAAQQGTQFNNSRGRGRGRGQGRN